MLQFWICSHMTCMVTTMKRRRRRMTIWRQCWPVWVDAGGESGLGAPCLARTRCCCCCRPPLLLLLLLLQTPTLPVSSDPPRHTHPLLLQQISSLFQTFNFCKYKVRLPRRGQNSQKYLAFSPSVSNGCYLIQKAKAFTHLIPQLETSTTRFTCDILPLSEQLKSLSLLQKSALTNPLLSDASLQNPSSWIKATGNGSERCPHHSVDPLLSRNSKSEWELKTCWSNRGKVAYIRVPSSTFF